MFPKRSPTPFWCHIPCKLHLLTQTLCIWNFNNVYPEMYHAHSNFSIACVRMWRHIRNDHIILSTQSIYFNILNIKVFNPKVLKNSLIQVYFWFYPFHVHARAYMSMVIIPSCSSSLYIYLCSKSHPVWLKTKGVKTV